MGWLQTECDGNDVSCARSQCRTKHKLFTFPCQKLGIWPQKLCTRHCISCDWCANL